jgi:thioredoxin 1
MITIKHFTATWCGPCKQLSPIMKDLVNETEGIGYQIIDVDQNPDAASRLGVRSLPTVIFEKNGTEVQRVVGLKPKSYYKQIISNL